MCLFVYLLINAQRFNSPPLLLHTHSQTRQSWNTFFTNLCMCVCFSSACDEWTVLPRPGLHRDVNRFGHSAVVSNGWVSSLLPCSRTLQQSLKTTTQILNDWITVMQIPVCSQCIIRWHISHFPWFLPAVSSKFWRHWASQRTFPFPRNFPVLLCRLFWDSSLYLSVKFSLSFHSSCHVFCWESCCSHLLHPADIWMFPQ